MALTKPPVLPPWAEAGDKVQPTNAEIQTGWPLSNTPPARQRWNWILNFLANGVRYLTRRGLPDYGADETYMIGDRVIGDDNKTYRSIQDNNINHAPSASPLWWEEWAPSLSRLADLLQKQTYTAFTTAGAAPNFTLTPSPEITAYTAGQRFRVKFHAAGSGADVLNINGLGNKSLKQYDNTGTKVAAVIAAGQLTDVEYDGQDMVIIDQLPPAMLVSAVNGGTGSVVVPKVSVRQTVLSCPLDNNGAPSFLPANSGALSVSSINIGAGEAALVVSAANGGDQYGVVDRIGFSTQNLTWNGLQANSTNYLFVDVAADGSMTTGRSLVAPSYQQNGSNPGTGDDYFCIPKMQMRDSAGNQRYRVYIGEAVTNAATVTSTVTYVPMGRYVSDVFSLSANTTYSRNHNIGTMTGVRSEVVAYRNSDGARLQSLRHIEVDSSGVTIGFGTECTAKTVSTRFKGSGDTYVIGLDASGVGVLPSAAKIQLNCVREW